MTEDINVMVDVLPGAGSLNGEVPINGEIPEGTEARASWLRGKQDRALILIGHAGALRRSEIAALRIEIEDRPERNLITVPESKTDRREKRGELGL